MEELNGKFENSKQQITSNSKSKPSDITQRKVVIQMGVLHRMRDNSTLHYQPEGASGFVLSDIKTKHQTDGTEDKWHFGGDFTFEMGTMEP